MGAEGRGSARAGWAAAASPAFFSVLALGVISLALLVWVDGLWVRSFRRTVPLLDNLMQARGSLDEGYVWLEELLRGNPAVDADLVADAYDQAVAAAEDSLEGCSAIPDLAGVPPAGSSLREELAKYRELTRRARDVARERWSRADQGRAAAVPDLQLLSAFHGLGLVARAVNGRLHEEIAAVVATQRRLRDLTLALWSCVLAGVSWALFVEGKRRGVAEDALRRAHADLERRVEERTAELVDANARLCAEIDERARTQAALARSERELRFLSSRLLSVQEDERARLARELHDGIVQTLAATRLRVELALRPGKKEGEGAAAESGRSAVRMLQGTLDDVRRMYMDLRPSLLDDLGLRAAAEWFCRQFGEAYPDLRVESDWAVAEADLPQPLKIVIYRILQECLTNVARHSQARTATIRLDRRDGSLELSVEDDGAGFDVAEALAVGEGARGLGLGSMRHRAEASGGSFSVESTAGAGTRVRAVWPLP